MVMTGGWFIIVIPTLLPSGHQTWQAGNSTSQIMACHAHKPQSPSLARSHRPHYGRMASLRLQKLWQRGAGRQRRAGAVQPWETLRPNGSISDVPLATGR